MKAILSETFVAIIFAFIIFCITPFFAKLRVSIFNFFERISKSFSNSFYQKASCRNTTNQITALSQIVLLFITMILASFYGSIISTLTYDPDLAKSEKIKELMKEYSKPDKSVDFEKEINNLYFKEIEKDSESFIIALGVLLALFIIYFNLKNAKSEIINSYIIEFNRDLHIIRPYISENEHQIFERDWALMKNKNDWIKINDSIEKKKRENK